MTNARVLCEVSQFFVSCIARANLMTNARVLCEVSQFFVSCIARANLMTIYTPDFERMYIISVLRWLIACFAHLEKLLERIATMKALNGSHQKKWSSCY